MNAEIKKGLDKAAESYTRLNNFYSKIMLEHKNISDRIDDAAIDGNLPLVKALEIQLQELDEQLENTTIALAQVDEYRQLLMIAKSIDDGSYTHGTFDEQQQELKRLFRQGQFLAKSLVRAESKAYHTISIRRSINRQLKAHRAKLEHLLGKKHPFIDLSVNALRKDLEKQMSYRYEIIDDIEKNANQLAESDFERVQNSEYLDSIDELLLRLYENLNRENPPQELAALMSEVELALVATSKLQQDLEAAPGRIAAINLRKEWKAQRSKWITALTKLTEEAGLAPEPVKALLNQIKHLLNNRKDYDNQRSSYAAKCSSLKAVLAKDMLRIINDDALEYTLVQNGKSYKYRDNYYDPVIFTLCFEDAIRDYVNLETPSDTATGKRMKLFKRFSIYYAKKKPDRINNAVRESTFGDHRVLEGAMRQALNYLLEENNLPKIKGSFPVRSRSKVKAYLEEHGASQDIIEDIDEQLEGVYIEPVELEGEEGETYENPRISNLLVNEQTDAIDQVADSAELVGFIKFLCEQKLPYTTEKLAKDITYWVTKKYLEILDGSSKVHQNTLDILSKYSDPEIIDAYQNHTLKDKHNKTNTIISVIAILEKKSQETIRNHMRQMERNIIPAFAKEYREAYAPDRNIVLYRLLEGDDLL